MGEMLDIDKRCSLYFPAAECIDQFCELHGFTTPAAESGSRISS
jgi:hypothetical protein